MDALAISDSIHEHLARCELYLALARQIDSGHAKFRLWMAAVYSLRAITDQIEREETNCAQAVAGTVTAGLAALPYSKLIDDLRVHDFHRGGFRPPTPGVHQQFMQGPVRLIARQGGMAVISGLGADQELAATRDSSIKQDRPVQQQNDCFWDPATAKWVPLDVIVRDHAKALQSYVMAMLEQG